MSRQMLVGKKWKYNIIEKKLENSQPSFQTPTVCIDSKQANYRI